MTLLALMYHHARAGRRGNAPDMLDRHFAHIARHYPCVLPGDALTSKQPHVCLTFDDAYFDFYAEVYPRLIRHDLRAVLAVPAAAIHERSSLSAKTRLALADRSYVGRRGNEGFCVWSELKEMADSGHVQIAAHGFTHRPIDDDDIDLHTEVVVPKTLLAGRLDRDIDTFVLPFGRFSKAALTEIERHYRYVFRIGGADNKGWDHRLLYRVDADELTTPDAPFRPLRRLSYRMRRQWNVLRGR